MFFNQQYKKNQGEKDVPGDETEIVQRPQATLGAPVKGEPNCRWVVIQKVVFEQKHKRLWKEGHQKAHF